MLYLTKQTIRSSAASVTLSLCPQMCCFTSCCWKMHPHQHCTLQRQQHKPKSGHSRDCDLQPLLESHWPRRERSTKKTASFCFFVVFFLQSSAAVSSLDAAECRVRRASHTDAHRAPSTCSRSDTNISQLSVTLTAHRLRCKMAKLLNHTQIRVSESLR